MNRLAWVIFFLVLLPVALALEVPGMDVVVDGDVGDWQGISYVPIEEFSSASVPSDGPSDFAGQFKSAWDSESLYFLIDVTDEEYDVTGDSVWERDGVELFIDGGNEQAGAYDSNDHQVLVLADGSSQGMSGVQAQAWQTGAGWRAEISLPWQEIGGQPPSSGATYGFTLAANDRDNEAFEHHVYWVRADNPDDQAVGWGELTLTGTASTCGDGLREGSERCDDGNDDDTDYCSTSCRVNTNAHDGFTFSNDHLTYASTDEARTLGVRVSDTAIYDTAYFSTDGGVNWESFTLTGDHPRNRWLLGDAQYDLILTRSAVDNTHDKLVAIYSCAWSGAWSCYGGDWQIKNFSVTVQDAPVSAECGNGEIEQGEACEPGNVPTTCSAQGYAGGTISCTDTCELDTSSCEEAVCGNGVLETGEECDGGDLAGNTCSTQGFDSGELSCSTETCLFDTSSCEQEAGTLTATTLQPTRLTSYSAQLNMELTDWGVRDRGEPWLEYREKGASEWIATERREVSYPTPWIHSEIVDGLTPATTYQVRARAFTWERTDAGEVIEFATNTEIGSAETDRAALMALYDSTNGDGWDDSTGWGGSADTLGSWHGITTNSGGRVQRVELQANNLVGTIPPEIGELSETTYLQLEQNDLTGNLPSELGDMRSLTHLYLAGRPNEQPNYRTGGYHPGKVDSVTNQYTGQIPPALGNLENLEMLRLERQGDMTGPLPPELGNLKNLKSLLLYGRYLDYESGFTGEVPPEYGNLENLVFFHIGRNAIEGALPEELGKLDKLKSFWFGGTRVTSFPESFKNMTSMVWLGADRSYTDMQFPYFLFEGTMTDLSALTFGWPEGDGFTGSLESVNFDNTPTMNHFSISGHSQMTGGLHESFTRVDPEIFNFAWTDRGGEGANGFLPQGSGYASWDNLRNLRLNDNALEGPIPVDIVDATGMLKQLDFQNNKFVPADIIPVLQAGPPGAFQYSPQKEFGHAETITLSPGETFSYDYSHKSHSNDDYQWTKDGSDLSGENSASITITSVDSGDEGDYRLEISNDLASSLGTLESEPITLVVN